MRLSIKRLWETVKSEGKPTSIADKIVKPASEDGLADYLQTL